MGLTKLLIVAMCVYACVLLGAVRVLRPGARRTVGALAGGVAAALVGVVIEAVAHQQGFWHYTESDTPVGPALIHPFNVIIFALIALIAWRIGRRFGVRGQAIYVGAVAIISPPGDYVVAVQWFSIIKIGPSVSLELIALMDIAAWGILSTVALAVMQMVAGLSKDDGAKTET
jgi:hypothetical protein